MRRLIERLFQRCARPVACLLLASVLFWLGEVCVGDYVLGLKKSLPIRAVTLLPWMVALVWSEKETGRLPNALTIGCLLTGIGVSVATDGVSVVNSAVAALSAFVVIVPLSMIGAASGGMVKMFVAVLSFWGVQLLPFVIGSTICMTWAIACLRAPVSRLFTECSAHGVPSSPSMMLSMLSVIVSIMFFDGNGMTGGYVFMAVILLVSVFVKMLTHGDVRTSNSKSINEFACGFPFISTDPDIPDSVHYRLSVFLDQFAEGKVVLPGFQYVRSVSPTHSRNMVCCAESTGEEGSLGLRAGMRVMLKVTEETDALPLFADVQKAISHLQGVRSRHVVKYYGCFQVECNLDGELQHYRVIVMEHLDGADLHYRILTRSPMFYADEIMYVLDQLLEGLCDLASAGIFHRDIKPANIFICRDGTVKLIDFGLSMVGDVDLCPKSRQVVGTPEFAAPDYLVEGFRGDVISDVFSVGMVLYYMMHGADPNREPQTCEEERTRESEFRDIWRERGVEAEDWWDRGGVAYGDWLSGGIREYVPLIGIRKILIRALSPKRESRFTSWTDFHSALTCVEFARAKCGKQWLRVISDSMPVSGAGDGWYCIYGRDERGNITSWGHKTFDAVFCRSDEQGGKTKQVLIHRMYDSLAPDAYFPVVDLSKGRNNRKQLVEELRSYVDDCIMKEPFEPENVRNVSKMFEEVKFLDEWMKMRAKHEFDMLQS